MSRMAPSTWAEGNAPMTVSIPEPVAVALPSTAFWYSVALPMPVWFRGVAKPLTPPFESIAPSNWLLAVAWIENESAQQYASPEGL
ncbi:hypothetical protein D3C87_1971870 [compost metagenome]